MWKYIHGSIRSIQQLWLMLYPFSKHFNHMKNWGHFCCACSILIHFLNLFFLHSSFCLPTADAPPLLCLGSIPSVADICVHFSNMTYRVDGLAMHKSQVLGCTDFSLNIYNKTISVFPVDCFQIPGDPNHHPKKENLIMPNFVPWLIFGSLVISFIWGILMFMSAIYQYFLTCVIMVIWYDNS